jgi:F0F1-type ATP synthase assembly protein I
MAKSPAPYRRPDLPFERKPKRLLLAGKWSAVGLEFGLAVVLFFLGGRALDEYLRTTQPWMAVVGAMIGVAVGTYLMIRPLLRSQRESDSDADSKGESPAPSRDDASKRS